MSILRVTERFNLSAGLASYVALAETIGFWPVLCGFALAAVEYVVSRIYGTPLWLVLPACIFTVGVTIWTFNQAAIYRRRMADTPSPGSNNFEQWDRFNELTIWDAACLWSGASPNALVLSERGLAIMRRIKHAVNTRRIPGAPLTEHGYASSNTMVSRDALKTLASMRNEKPAFLYPDVRTNLLAQRGGLATVQGQRADA